jgi:hypothetical protein
MAIIHLGQFRAVWCKQTDHHIDPSLLNRDMKELTGFEGDFVIVRSAGVQIFLDCFARRQRWSVLLL